MTHHKGKKNKKNLTNILQTAIGFIAHARRATLLLLIAAAALTILVLLVSIGSFSSADPRGALGTFTVRRGDLTITVTESGSIKARNTIDIKSEVEGQTTIISIVPEGTYISEEDVNNGKILVELDSSNLTEQLALREIEFASAEASYADANEAYHIQLKQNESDITAAELSLKFAEMDLKKYLGESLAQKLIAKANPQPSMDIDVTSLLEDPNKLGGAANQKLNELEDAITLAQETLIRSENKLRSTRKLYDANYVSKFELQGDELSVKSNKIQLEQAGTSLRLFKLYDFPKQVQTYISTYEEAKRELDRTKARARSLLAQAQAKLKSAQAQYQLRRDHVQKLKRQIAACTIKAPAPGLVVYSSSGDWFRQRERRIEEGAMVIQRQKIISLPDTSEMIVEIDVHESSIDKVQPNQPAKITIDAFPDKTFHGKVLKVSPLPDPQRGWLNPDLKVYATQVTIEAPFHSLQDQNPDQRVKPFLGMSAKVEILVDQLQDVIIVPIQAVANRNGKKFCYIATPRGTEPREVVTGAFNETFVQIVDGLQVGEQILLNPPRLVQSAAPAQAKADGEKTRPPKPKTLEKPSPEQMAQLKQKWNRMSPEEKQKFINKMRQKFPPPEKEKPGN